MTADKLDRLDTLAKIGASLVGVQIEAVGFAAVDLASDGWTFGYSFGVFESMARYARLDQYTEGAAMIAAGFGKLVNAPSQGRPLLSEAVTRMDQPDFAAGAEAGANDLMAWAQDANALPTSLAARGRKAAT